jgi:hypothetical protein
MLTEEQISEAVASALPDVLRGLREQIKESALNTAKYAIHDQITSKVKEWVDHEIVPEMIRVLVEEKEGLIRVAPVFASKIVETLTESLVEMMRNKLESSWERKKIFEALIG